MFSFTHEQKVMEISGVHIGGQPGLHPTVLFGGVFFKGDPDFQDAKRHLQTLVELSKDTGVPVIPDFFIRKESFVEPIIEFIEKTLPRYHPFSVDIIDPAIKIKTLEYLHEKRLLSRTIYNSIHIGSTKQEIEMLTLHPREWRASHRERTACACSRDRHP
jgi:tetrahydromethanopterin S-methyltransferase subunit H